MRFWGVAGRGGVFLPVVIPELCRRSGLEDLSVPRAPPAGRSGHAEGTRPCPLGVRTR